MLRITLLIVLINTALISGVSAQTLPPPPPAFGTAPMIGGLESKAGMAAGVSIEGIDETPVKAVPFCAVISTEHTQVFVDGNRIHTTDASTFCRDSMGRTRREANLNMMGAAPRKAGMKLITIVDPIAGYRYVLDTNTKTARRMALQSMNSQAFSKGTSPAPPSARGDVMFFRTAEAPGPNVVFHDVFVNKAGHEGEEPPPASENLGDQTIDGIHATGTRITTTIPAGRMGNEQPISVTSERWYSPELKATVLTKHDDPWAGELKTQFTNVNQAEPDTSLFAVPSDYKVVDDKAGTFTIKLPPPAPPAQ